MLRLDKSYYSLFAFLAGKFSIAERIYEHFYPKENHPNRLVRTKPIRWNPNINLWSQFFGGFQPAVYMRKDFLDTFKPYKSKYHIKRDFLQPIRGVGNLIKGIANLVLVPVSNK